MKETECTQCEHKPTYRPLHRRQHIHGALPIQSGERINLIIIWMRSSAVRNKLCLMCNRVPGWCHLLGDLLMGLLLTLCQSVLLCNVIKCHFPYLRAPYDALRRCKNCSKYCDYYRGPEAVYS